MKNPRLSNRYAKALFDFAQEKGQLEEVNQDLALIKAALKGNNEMTAVLNSPVIPPAKKHTVFANEELRASCSISIQGMIDVIAKAADNAA